MMYLKYFALLLTACSSISATSRSQYEYEAVESTEVLQHEFYNMSSGLFYGYNATCDCYADFWWNSANCITTLADLTAIDRSAAELTFPIFGNTYIRAQKYNLMQQKMGSPSLSYHDHCIWPWHWTCPYGQPKPIIPGGFINDYWDDAGWWALGWIAVYDNTHDKRYLDTAVDIFDHMAFEGYNATCGAMWWNKEHQQQNAITNELFLSVAAHLAARVENSYYYINWALRQWRWFENSGLIRPSGLIVDAIDNTTCEVYVNNASFSYNQGVILGALVELNKVHPNHSYIDTANTIAHAAIANLSDANGILTEFGSNGSPDLGFDGPTFKGVFIRNLQVLQQATGSQYYANYIRKQADSIWSKDRSPKNGTLGNVWDKYYGQVLPQGHCAAMDALVAAAAVS